MIATPFQLFNSLTRTKQLFAPLEVGKIGLYVCGVTVYDDCHLGHARVMLFFDLMVRFLRQQGWSVRYIRNITDIDDKIVKRAFTNNETVSALTSRVIASMNADLAALGVSRPTVEPRATEYIQAMIAFIARLLALGAAYTTASGNVYFDINAYPQYGQLSGKKREDLLTGVRVELEADKKSAADFALWKVAADNEPSWSVPWSEQKGRPGWHIECSAMAKSCLGDEFDIHGGGPDLVFPHHENEIAQSEVANQRTFAHYWMHVGSLQVEGKKMSKSLGNFVSITDALARYSPAVIRYFAYSTHYRKPLNYTEGLLQQSKQSLATLLQAVERAALDSSHSARLPADYHNHPLYRQWVAAMCDDFNTPQAFAVLFMIAKAMQRTTICRAERQALARLLCYCAAPLGIIPQKRPSDEAPTDQMPFDHDTLMGYLKERQDARGRKDFTRADAIRALLLQHHILLHDNPNGTTSWTLNRP